MRVYGPAGEHSTLNIRLPTFNWRRLSADIRRHPPISGLIRPKNLCEPHERSGAGRWSGLSALGFAWGRFLGRCPRLGSFGPLALAQVTTINSQRIPSNPKVLDFFYFCGPVRAGSVSAQGTGVLPPDATGQTIHLPPDGFSATITKNT